MERLMAGRTTIVIAHRLSTVRRSIASSCSSRAASWRTGDHDDLMRRPDGVYRKLLETQIAMGEIADAAE